MSSANDPYSPVSYPAPMHDDGPDSDYSLHPPARGVLERIDLVSARDFVNRANRRVCELVSSGWAEALLVVFCILSLPSLVAATNVFVAVLSVAWLAWIGRRMLRAAYGVAGDDNVMLRVTLWGAGAALSWLIVTSGEGTVLYLPVLGALTYVGLYRSRAASTRDDDEAPRRWACSVSDAHRRTWGETPDETQAAVVPSTEFVGAVLDDLSVRFPHVRVFHGVSSNPGREGPSVGHAVLIGTRVVLVESRNWMPGHYAWGEDGQILRDGVPVRSGEPRLPDAVEVWRAHSGRLFGTESTVQARLVPVASGGPEGRHEVEDDGSQGAVRLADLASLVTELEAQATAANRVVDRYSMGMLIKELR